MAQYTLLRRLAPAAAIALALSVSALIFTNSNSLFSNDANAQGAPCGLAMPAFCDTFDQPQNGGTRSGDLNSVVWGASRASGYVNAGQGINNGWFPTQLEACDGPRQVQPPQDVIICNGQMREATNDGHQVTTLAMYPKQPFDFAGRTGKVVFDVSNDSLNTHDAWPEFWLTDKPVPTPFNHFDSWQSLPRHGLAVRFAAGAPAGQFGFCQNGNNLDKQRWTVDSAAVVRDYVLDDTTGVGPRQVSVKQLDCVIAGSLTDGLNHVELDISQNQVDVYATDAGTTAPLHHIAIVQNANLSLSRGLIWIEDVHYNASKACCNDAGPHETHTFVWDNVGFDGPLTYHDLSFDALDVLRPNGDGSLSLGKASGPNAATSWDVLGMPASPTADAVRVLFNFFSFPNPTVLNVTVNGNAHQVPWPYPDNRGFTWRTLDALVPITDLVSGTNKVTVGGDQGLVVSNVNVVLVNAGAQAAPTVAPTTSPTVAPTAVPTTTPTNTPTASVSGCRFQSGGSAAFCEDGTVSPGGRAGDLDDARWSVGRVDGEYSPPNMMPFPAVAARCKTGTVSPDNDIFACNGGFETALGAQNYALLSMRPRQAFDFAGRTGTITYNVDAATGSPQGWWHSLYVTQDPVPGGANTGQVSGMTPRNGVGVNFDGNNCPGNLGTSVRVNSVYTFNDYAETSTPFANSVCIQTKAGSQNHIEVRLSQSRIEVWASDFSPDGVTFPNFRLIGSAALNLNFSQGYVHFQHAQRAPVKYFSIPSSNYTWSKMGFDGPVVGQETGYTVPDALTSTGGKLNVGYGLKTTPNTTFTCCPGVTVGPFNLGNVTGNSPMLTFSILYVNSGTGLNSSTYAVKYRFNGGAWQSVSAEYAKALSCQGWGSGECNWSMAFAVPVSGLVAGQNTVEIASDGSGNGYPPLLANVELLTFGATAKPPTPVPPTATPTKTTAATVTPTPRPSRTYSTSFPATENPISEAANWISGKAALDWADVRTTAGKAFGTQPGNETGNARYDDSTAVVTGAWGTNQGAQATVFVNGSLPNSTEVELRLRTSITPHSITGYEFECSTSAVTPYVDIVRWDGPLGGFTPLVHRDGILCANGDVLGATAVGSTLTLYKNGVAIVSATDATYSNGAPGIGMYLANQTGINASYGYVNFSGCDCGALPPLAPPPPTPTPTKTPVPPTATPVPPTATTVPPTSTPQPPSGLHVVGNRLVDGSPVQLRGVSRAGGEYMCSSGSSDSFDGPTDQASIDAIKAWGVNTVRLPLNEDCWLGINGIPTNMTVAKYRQQVTSFVNLLTSNGLYVVLDLHWSAPGTVQALGQNPMPDADHSPAFWTSVATTFKTTPSVLFDLFNEPYPDSNQNTTAAWTCLRDGGTCSGVSYQVAGMQTLVNTVRATGATNVILSPGVNYAGGMDRWLEFKPTDPLNNLAASWHTYAPNGNQCNNQACWESLIAPIAASLPLVAGEIGQIDCASTYIVPLMTWLDGHNGNYLVWAWDVYDCAGFPSLISDYSGTPTNYGIGLRDHLLGVTPTPTPQSTPTVAPTATPAPTSTPVPATATPVPPTATPSPTSTSTPAPDECFVSAILNGTPTLYRRPLSFCSDQS